MKKRELEELVAQLRRELDTLRHHRAILLNIIEGAIATRIDDDWLKMARHWTAKINKEAGLDT